MITRTTRSLPLFLYFAAAPAFAQAPIDIDTDFAPGTHTRFAERVNQGQTSMYAEVLAAYDARLSRYPEDVSSSVERCRFIQTFAYAEDMIIESANEDLEACQEQLKQGRHAHATDVILYGVETSWKDEDKAAAQALIPESRNWTREQQATLFELLTDKFQWSEPELAAQYAIRAVGLKPGSRVLITAVNRWIQLGAKDKARRLLLGAPASTWETVPRFSAAKLLVDIGDPKAAAALLQGEASADGSNNKMMLARILAQTGEIKGARELYRGFLDKGEYVDYESRLEYFEFERRHGTRADAVAAYHQLRNEGFGADILARQRLSLFFAYPGVAWAWRDVSGLLLLAALLLLFAALPALAVMPVHYRGLARRVRGLAPDKSSPIWTLRQSWYALAVFTAGGAIALYAFSPATLEMVLPWSKRLRAENTDIELGQQLLAGSVLALLLVLPLMRGRPIRSILLGRWSVLRSVLTGIGLAIGLKIVAMMINLGLQSAGVLGNDTMRAMQGAHQSFGMLGMLLIVAAAVPFVEELVFRGVVLEAFRGQVSFVFATIVQAATFALSHESPGDMPMLFVFGLVAGWLARRSEGLLAPMAMHSMFNLTAALTVVGLTSALNR